MGLSAHSPVRPASPHVAMLFRAPRRRAFEKMASASSSESDWRGLSLFTNTPRASTAVRIWVGLYPHLDSNPSSSVGFMARDIGPNCAVPWVMAGGAVADPLPSIWMLTLG